MVASASLSAAAFASSRESGCVGGATLKHWSTPVAFAFSHSEEVPLVIKGHAGSYPKEFLDFLKEDHSWGLGENGMWIQYSTGVGEGARWRISDNAAPITAPTLYNEDGTVLGNLWKKYVAMGVGILGAYDHSKFPPSNWVVLPEVSGNKPYIILDRASESDPNLIVSLEPGFYRGPDVNHGVTVCFIPAP